MPTHFCVGDTETGGLDDRINPLLSAALLLADHEYNEIDGFGTKVLPPPNTWLEIPIREHQTPNFGFSGRNIDYYLEVHTGLKSTRKPDQGYLINAGAADTNGFIKGDQSGWDLESYKVWLAESMPLELAEEVFIRWLVKHCSDMAPIGVAHNAVFDVKYFQRYLPKLFSYFAVIDPALRADKKLSELSSGWYCTCTALKKYNKISPRPAENAKLGSLAKCAGYVPDGAHEALADTRSCLAGLRWLKTGKTFSTNSVAGLN